MHIPVLSREVLEFLKPKPGDDFLDATLGRGGHAREILKRTAPRGRLLGIDLSAKAIQLARKELKEFGSRAILVQGNFRNLKKIYYDSAMDKFDGILADLGVSSEELEDADLGISFKMSAPLDMRLGGKGVSAKDIVNGSSKDELAVIIRTLGEERYADKVAKAITEARRKERIKTTDHLAKIIVSAVPKSYERGRIHPATRTFQALRIAVNRELENLELFLPQATELLKTGGRIAVISFHSLEDRIVKRFFREHNGKELFVLTKRPVQSDEEELKVNPRARSAKLRAAKKL